MLWWCWLALAEEPAVRTVDEPWGPYHDVAIDVDEATWVSVSVHEERVVFDVLGDLWSMPLSGGDATRLTSGMSWDVEPAFSPDGAWIAFSSDRSGNRELWVMRADGTGARQVTHEGVARVNDPVWDPAAPGWLIGRRRTVDTRSTGVTELWSYPIPVEGGRLEGGSGVALTSFEAHPHAGEAWPAGERYLYFSSRSGRFNYDANPMESLWQVARLDRTSGTIRPVVYGAGSAARPVVSADGDALFFISRALNRTLLERIDLETGVRRVLGDWLSRDQMESLAVHGTYPRPALTADGDLVLWAQGGLWRVDPESGERVAVPMRVRGDWRMMDTKPVTNEIDDTVHARMLRWGAWAPDGSVAFSALGRLWVRRPDGVITPTSGDRTGYAPAWHPDGKTLAWTTWDDVTGGRLLITSGRREEVLPVTGQLVQPSWSPDGDALVVLRGVPGSAGADLSSVAAFDVVLLTRDKRGWTASVVTTVANPGSAEAAPQPTLWGGRVWIAESRETEARKPSSTAWVSYALDGSDKQTHALLGGADQVIPSPDHRHLAWRAGLGVHVARLPASPRDVDLSGGAAPAAALTTARGQWLGWTADGAALTWIEGDTFVKMPVAGLDDASIEPERVVAGLELPRHVPSTIIALEHARVITMRGDEVLEDATVLVVGDTIQAVGRDVPIPAGATRVDCTGRTVFPGLVDVHAHLHYTAGDVLPSQEWRYLVSLDYGVTTVHDPSASTDTVFTQAERVEAGFMQGPRVFSTGWILYGALSNQASETPTLDDARAHVSRMTGYGARTVKVYQQSQRERRQWYAQVCAEEGVGCVLEGGVDLWQDLEAVVDGFGAVEHNLPVAPLHADVRALFAGAVAGGRVGTFYTPTLLVAYGGLTGQHGFWVDDNPLDDPRMLRHWPVRELQAMSWRRPMYALDTELNHEVVAREAAALARLGVPVTLGAHGALQGLGVHWELWSLAASGAMTPHEALRAGTATGARYLGLEDRIGTVAAGYLADLVIVDGDPLEDIRRSDDIFMVVKNGGIWR